MKKRIAILGAGMQGPAVAYDIARFGEPEIIYLADIDLERATLKAEWVNQLIQRTLVYPRTRGRPRRKAGTRLLRTSGCDYQRGALADEHAVGSARLASQAQLYRYGQRAGMVLVRVSQATRGSAGGRYRHRARLRAGTGMVNHLGLYCMEKMDRCDAIHLRCGGLPQRPVGPLGYKLVFNMIGVISEYTGNALTPARWEAHLCPHAGGCGACGDSGIGNAGSGFHLGRHLHGTLHP
jgi:lysine 6-dehydrogenase